MNLIYEAPQETCEELDIVHSIPSNAFSSLANRVYANLGDLTLPLLVDWNPSYRGKLRGWNNCSL